MNAYNLTDRTTLAAGGLTVDDLGAILAAPTPQIERLIAYAAEKYRLEGEIARIQTSRLALQRLAGTSEDNEALAWLSRSGQTLDATERKCRYRLAVLAGAEPRLFPIELEGRVA